MQQTAQPEFDDLYQKFKQPVYSFAFSLTQNPGDADDLFQETWLRIVQNLKKARSTGNLKSWVFTIAMNIHRDNLRKKKVRKMFFLKQTRSPEKNFGSQVNDRADRNQNVCDEIYRTDIQRAITQAISTLPRRLKQVFVLKEIEGYKYKEVSDMLEMPIGTVKSVNHRAVRRMRRELWIFSPDIDLNTTRRKENEVPGR